MDDNKLTTYVEVTASVTMSKSLCIEVPEGATKEEVLELAKKEFIIPTTGIQYLEGILAQVGVRVQGINDIRDWDIDELEYVTDYESEQLNKTLPEQPGSGKMSDAASGEQSDA